VQPLRDLGVDETFVANLEARLKPIVDAGYSRNNDRGEPQPDLDGPADESAETDRPTPRIPRLARLFEHAAPETAADGATGEAEPTRRLARLADLRNAVREAAEASAGTDGDAPRRSRMAKREVGSRVGLARAARAGATPEADGPGGSDHGAGADE
jgi:hypothetical protein